MKATRHARIREIIEHNVIETQEDLANALKKQHIVVTQATVSRDIKELMRLPGVGRKTANVIASVVFDLPAMAVDTHVFRVSNRIGLTVNSKTPLETEKELVKHIPEELIPKAHHWLILHGRYVCVAKKPKCESCGLTAWCAYFQKKT